jgi:DNA primase catalytic subunit
MDKLFIKTMKLPFNMRTTTLEERKQFYSNFDIKQTKKWLKRKLVYAVIIGRHSDIYPKKYEEDKNIPLIIDKYKNINEVKQHLLNFLPEGVYYDRNYYRDITLCHSYNLRKAWEWDNFIGQELAFDIDSENVICPIHGSLQKRMNHGWGLSFCEKAFELTKENTINLYEKLAEDYSKIKIVFSGRGFHIHVFDKETIIFSRKQRENIARKFNKYGIDRWVTSGEMRLIRLPYTLNALSSRIVKPISKKEVESFNPEKEALPSFIK